MKNKSLTPVSDSTIKDTIKVEDKQVSIPEHTDFNLPVQIEHIAILSKLIDQIEPVNLRALAGINDTDEKLTQKAIIVSTVSELISLAQKNSWHICKNNEFIYVFNGFYWKYVNRDSFKDFLGKAVEKMGVKSIDAQYFEFRDKLYKQFCSAGILPSLNRSKSNILINLENGTFEISKAIKKLRDFNSFDFQTYQLPFRYDPLATATKFQLYLDRVLPDAELQLVLAEFVAYIFTDLKLEKVLLLYGSGANGKSVFFDIMNALLGPENVSNYSLKSLGHEYHRAKIANKLLNYGSEINSNIESDLFKQLASGEPIEARLPYGEPFNIYNYARLCFNCNALPRDVEQTEAFFRRFLIIPFEVTIPEEDRDPELAQKIISAELSGVFNWVLLGLDRLLVTRKFTRSQRVNDILSQYREESDSVAMFLKEASYVPHENGNFTLKELFNEYRTYCIDDGYKQCSKKTFRNRLDGMNITIRRTAQGNMVHVILAPGNVY